MAYNIIRPRRGIKSLWDTYKGRIYKNGEMLVESPETGVGSGPVNVKFGDGVTDYEHLPYAILAPTTNIEQNNQRPVTSDGVFKALENVAPKVDVVDNLLSDSSTDPLSAKQGKVLNGKFGGCYIAFMDADGNPTDTPYLHWDEEVDD